MSILDGLIFGIRKLFVNGAEQPLKSELELVGANISVAQIGEKSVVTITGGSGADGNTTAQYILGASSADLPNSRVLSGAAGVQVDTSSDGALVISPIYGSAAGTVCQGDDGRLSDDRTASGIRTATTVVACSSAAAPSEGQALVATSTAAATWQTIYGPYSMGSEGSIPFAGQDAAAGVQFLETATALPGWQLSVSAAGVPEYSARSRWRRTYFTSLDDGWSMAMTAESMRSPYPIPQIGLPIRIADKSPIVYGDTYGNYASIFASISGTLSKYADHRGRIYPSLVSDGSGAFHVNFYSDARRTILFGHTASFSAVGTVAFVADNGSGLSGTCAIAGTLTANSTAILQIFKYAILTGVDFENHYIFWTGEAVGCPEALWIGDPELVRPLDITIQGAYAGVTTSQAIYDRTGTKCYCDFAAAHLVALQCIHGTADTTVAPKIAMVHAGVLTVSDANAFAVSTSRSNALPDVGVVDSTRCVESGQALELRVQKLGTGDAANLSAVAVYVLE